MMDGMGWTSPEAHELFNLVAQQQAEERRKQRERLSDTVKTYLINVEPSRAGDDATQAIVPPVVTLLHRSVSFARLPFRESSPRP